MNMEFFLARSETGMTGPAIFRYLSVPKSVAL
jgi:hypothetical protein